SRRRHTRSKRDWSSDVCSSDLDAAPAGTAGPAEQVLVLVHVSTARPRLKGVGRRRPETFGQAGAVQTADLLVRRSTRITALPAEIGRASCRERGEMSAGAGGAM